MKNKDTIAEITSDTSDKKITMSLSDMEELISAVIKKQRKKHRREKKAEAEEELENYLLPSDITDIIDDFAPIEHLIKTKQEESSDSFIDLMCGLTENAIYTRVRDLSRQRKIEKATEFASAQARDNAETPRYYRPLRRLFRLTPNRAMELIIKNAEQTARLLHMRQQVENDELEALADDWEEKYKKGQPIDFDEEEPDEDGAESAPTLPARKQRAKPAEASEDTDGEE